LRAGAGLRLFMALGILSLLNCEREGPPPAAAPPAQAIPPHPLEPWRWHMVGGLLVSQVLTLYTTPMVMSSRIMGSVISSRKMPKKPVKSLNLHLEFTI